MISAVSRQIGRGVFGNRAGSGVTKGFMTIYIRYLESER